MIQGLQYIFFKDTGAKPSRIYATIAEIEVWNQNMVNDSGPTVYILSGHRCEAPLFFSTAEVPAPLIGVQSIRV